MLWYGSWKNRTERLRVVCAMKRLRDDYALTMTTEDRVQDGHVRRENTKRMRTQEKHKGKGLMGKTGVGLRESVDNKSC